MPSNACFNPSVNGASDSAASGVARIIRPIVGTVSSSTRPLCGEEGRHSVEECQQPLDDQRRHCRDDPERDAQQSKSDGLPRCALEHASDLKESRLIFVVRTEHQSAQEDLVGDGRDRRADQRHERECRADDDQGCACANLAEGLPFSISNPAISQRAPPLPRPNVPRVTWAPGSHRRRRREVVGAASRSARV